MLLQRHENAVIQHGSEDNEKLKLETLFRSALRRHVLFWKCTEDNGVQI